MAATQRDAVSLLDERLDAIGAGHRPGRDDEHGERRPRIAPRRLRAILRASDIFAASVAWLVALWASGLDLGVRGSFVAGSGLVALCALGTIRGLYLARVSSIRSLELAALLGVCAWSAATGTVVARIALGEQAVAQLTVLLSVAFLGQFALLATGRSIYDDWLKQHRARGENCRRVVLIGYDDALASLCATLRDHPEVGFRVAGYFGPDLDDGGDSVHPTWLGGYEDVTAWIEEDGASGVIVSAAAMGSSEVGVLVRELLDAGVHVDLSPGLAGIDSRRLRPLPLAHEPLLHIERGGSTLDRERVKRAIDLVAAPLALLVASPVLLVSMLAVKLGDGGPVFYSQERVGRHGRTFRMWKLRTMVVDAERRRDELDEYNARTGPLFKAVDDPRVTRVGRILRALSIDEIPQLFNVLSGRMTLVGPRPALPAEVEEFDVELRRRLDVVPGLTGLWQVEARDNPHFSAYRRLDLFYLDNWSVSLDLVILVLTLHVVVIRAVRSLVGRFDPLVGRARGRRGGATDVRRTPTDTARAPRVLILVQNLPVPLDRRVWQESRSLVAAGFDVSVICPAGPGDRSFEVLEDVEIHRYRPPVPRQGVAGYVVEFLYCWLATARLAVRCHRRHRVDVIQACNPPDTFWALALPFRLLGVRFVYDQHDLCPEVFDARFGGGRPMLSAGLRVLERASYATADEVISTNESYARVARSRGRVDPAKVTVVRSGPDPAVMRRGEAREELRAGSRHLLVWLGIMGPQDGVDILLEAMRVMVHDLERKDVHLAILGFGDCYDDLREQCSALGLDAWVTFTGRADGVMIDDYFSTADIGLCPDPKNPFNDASTMNKVLEYMAYELPIVSFDLAESRVSAGEAALFVASDEATDLAEAILELLADPDRRRAMGRAGRARLEAELGWPAQAEQYVALYARLCDRIAVARPEEVTA